MILWRPLSQRKSENQQIEMINQWKQSMIDVANQPTTTVDDISNDDIVLLKDMLGILKIDRINFEMPVLKGTSENTLKVAVGTIEPTAMPSENENFCLAVHNSLRKDKYLNRAMELKLGDTIIYQDSETQYSYRITELVYVEPTDTSMLEQSDKFDTITIVTCYPADTAEQRYIIRGEKVK